MKPSQMWSQAFLFPNSDPSHSATAPWPIPEKGKLNFYLYNHTDVLEWLCYVNESTSNMSVSETLNKNWQAKRWFRQSIPDVHFGQKYILRESRERERELKENWPLQKRNIIIRIIKITFILSLKKEKKKTLFKSIQYTLVIREHLASSNISSQMVFLKDERKISNCNLNKYR